MLHRFKIGLAAAILIAGAHSALAQTVVFDSLTSAASYTITTSTPHTQIGQIFNLANLSSTTGPLTINGSNFVLAATSGGSYTDVQVTQYFWATASGATSGSTAAYSTLLGSYTYSLGAQNVDAGFVYTFNRGANSYATPVVLSGLTTPGQIGFSQIVRTNSGSGLVLNESLFPAFTTGTPAFGSNSLTVNGISGYYRNALGETNGNFVGSDARNLANPVTLGVSLFANGAVVPETSSVVAFLSAALPFGGLALIRRRRASRG